MKEEQAKLAKIKSKTCLLQSVCLNIKVQLNAWTLLSKSMLIFSLLIWVMILQKHMASGLSACMRIQLKYLQFLYITQKRNSDAFTIHDHM